jgi:3-hydroxyisobutyrate dehydrogenase
MIRSVAVLGTGKMGAGMTRSLLRAGFEVTAWNRSGDRAAPLAGNGAKVAGSAAEAVAQAGAVLTMLWDGDSVAEVMDEALPAATDELVWLQTSTVGVRDAADRLPGLASAHGAAFVDAPVLGTRQPAEDGKLLVLASGPVELRERIEPVLSAIGAGTVWVSERPGDGTRLKLVANSWVASLVAATAQAIAFAEGLGLDPQVFLDAVKGGAVDTPYLHVKGQAMISGEFPAAFGLDGMVKDTGLIAAAMRDTGTDTTLIDALGHQFRAAANAGHADEDMAAVVHAFRQRSG